MIKRFFKLDGNEHILGTKLIKGIERDPDDEDPEDDGDKDVVDTSKYTQQQIQSLRFILIAKNRDAQDEAMRKLVLGDQAHDSFLTFNTPFSYHHEELLVQALHESIPQTRHVGRLHACVDNI